MSFATVEVKNLTPTIINKLTTGEIKKLKKKSKPGVIDYGLTRVDLNRNPKFTTEVNALKSKQTGKIDVYYKPLSINLSFSWVKIWIAKELKPLSCPNKAVLIHEKKHVTLAHKVLRTYANNLENSLNRAKIPVKTKPSIVMDSQRSFDTVCKKYDNLVKSIVQKEYMNKEKLQSIYNEIGKAWKKLDSEDEYNRVKNSCRKDEWPF